MTPELEKTGIVVLEVKHNDPVHPGQWNWESLLMDDAPSATPVQIRVLATDDESEAI